MEDGLAGTKVSKPVLGLVVGGMLGLLDGLSGFFEPSLAPVNVQRDYFFALERIALRHRDWICFAASPFDAPWDSVRESPSLRS